MPWTTDAALHRFMSVGGAAIICAWVQAASPVVAPHGHELLRDRRGRHARLRQSASEHGECAAGQFRSSDHCGGGVRALSRNSAQRGRNTRRTRALRRHRLPVRARWRVAIVPAHRHIGRDEAGSTVPRVPGNDTDEPGARMVPARAQGTGHRDGHRAVAIGCQHPQRGILDAPSTRGSSNASRSTAAPRGENKRHASFAKAVPLTCGAMMQIAWGFQFAWCESLRATPRRCKRRPAAHRRQRPFRQSPAHRRRPARRQHPAHELHVPTPGRCARRCEPIPVVVHRCGHRRTAPDQWRGTAHSPSGRGRGPHAIRFTIERLVATTGNLPTQLRRSAPGSPAVHRKPATWDRRRSDTRADPARRVRPLRCRRRYVQRYHVPMVRVPANSETANGCTAWSTSNAYTITTATSANASRSR